MSITAHHGVQLSPSPSSLTPALHHVGVNTADLEVEGSEAFTSDEGDDSRSEG